MSAGPANGNGAGPADRAAPRLERAHVRRSFDRASVSYEAAAVLQTRVRAELIERLALVPLEPRTVLDLGAGTGQGARELRRRFPRARILALDLAPGMLSAARRHSGLLRRFDRVCADAARLPLASGSVDLVFSNLMLQWCDDLGEVLAEVRRVLRPGGFFALSTFGPDTLCELRAAWAEADASAHVSAFLDMHDVGDALAHAGLTEPVLDVERVRLTYDRVLALVHDLQAIGARNALATRRRGLTSPRRWRAMTDAYERYRADGRLPATFEVIYGAAWAPSRPPAGRAAAGQAAAGQAAEVRIPAGAIGRRNRP